MPASLDLNRFAQLKATGHLPSPRGVAVAIMRMAQDETVSLVELARVIKGDPAFVGRLIKAANGLLVRQRAIVSVSEALMVVGLAAVRAMVLGFSLLSNYRKGNCLGFDYMRFWSSSIVMAIAMQTFATRTRQIAADEAFSVGLLARIGELALATVYPSKYAHVLADAAAKPGADLCELEQQTLALTHADLGGAMLADWGVPRVFNLPVRFYEHPAAAPVSNESREAAAMQCLSLSRIVADLCFAEPAAQADLMARAVRQAAQMGCPREALLVDCGEIAKQWKEWAKLLQLEATDTPPFEMLSVESTHKPETRHEISESAPSAPEVRSPTSSVSPLPAVSGLRAMVVERAGNERVRLAKALRGIGVDAHEFVDLGGVLEKVLDVQPHIMVLNGSDDPGHVGRLIKALRASRIGRSIYVLLLLSGDDEASIAVFESGADDYLVKPISSRMLLARLAAAQRIVLLQQDLEHEREELRHFAAELAISNRCLQEAALTDALTGLPNRRYARERVQQEWAAARRADHTISCMVIDLDDFKHFNDNHGHDVGDIVLRQAAETLRQALRAQDVICRTGGDEFLVICPSVPMTEALTCGERLRRVIDEMTIENDEVRLHLTISVGIAVRDATMVDSAALVKSADRALFLAKKHGRNKVWPEVTIEGEEK